MDRNLTAPPRSDQAPPAVALSLTNQKSKRGPDPDHLKIEGDWEDVLKEVLEKKRPKEGWPKLEETDDDPDPVEKADD